MNWAQRFVLFLFLFASIDSNAQIKKFNMFGGLYALAAASPATESTPAVDVKISSPGTFLVNVNFEILPSIEVGAGYSIFFSKGLSGDMGFGPDFSLDYFFWNRGSGIQSRDSKVSYQELEEWRPFVEAAFHQRQFQSVQSAFSGFGFGVGIEYQIQPTSALISKLRMMNLTGPAETKLSFNDLLIGYQLQF